MCAILGLLSDSRITDVIKETFWVSQKSMLARGPDNQASVILNSGKVLLAHNRLSIVDISSSSNQPFFSTCKRYVLVFNGEIYNFCELYRDYLKSDQLGLGHSDTEVLLNLIVKLGIRQTLNLVRGMFAFCFYDIDKNVAILARDRFGEKPLYYQHSDLGLIFSSTYDIFTRLNNCINEGSIHRYLQYGYIPVVDRNESSVIELTPGTYITVDNSGEVLEEKYFDAIAQARKQKLIIESNKNLNYYTDHLHELLRDVISEQMVTADVPVGSFLSSGVDSSIVTAIASEFSRNKVQCFSAGFDEKSHDESKKASIFAEYIGAEHETVWIKPADVREIISEIPSWFAEPFADSSQVPTYYVSKLASERVTVALSGDGGDEIFGGYERYKLSSTYWGYLRLLPAPFRNLISSGLGKLNLYRLEQYFITLQQMNFSRRAQKFADILCSKNQLEMYHKLISISPGIYFDKNFSSINSEQNFSDIDKFMLMDTLSYLPGDILKKVDRCSMKNSLETRAPFLDPRVFDFAWSLPAEFKCHGGETKIVLKNLQKKLYKGLNLNIPKRGFSWPIEHWIRKDLLDIFENLGENYPSELEIFCSQKYYNENLKQHCSGKFNRAPFLWAVLMLANWFESIPNNLKVK